MKKIYDLRINNRGSVDPMKDGFFAKWDEHYHALLADRPCEYVMIECPRAIYRIAKSDLETRAVQKFLAQANRMTPKED